MSEVQMILHTNVTTKCIYLFKLKSAIFSHQTVLLTVVSVVELIKRLILWQTWIYSVAGNKSQLGFIKRHLLGSSLTIVTPSLLNMGFGFLAIDVLLLIAFTKMLFVKSVIHINLYNFSNFYRKNSTNKKWHLQI